ncbi:hypothetical protein BCIN_07g03650 [Botrytis cinerea B05.10]|uniref:Uncharacterized protein n=1 Tax=Botryotinia fuckeliana (strain B05.10) TaxID=332648 RepID=A0A384JMT6_BOTFB|nr:hypothetical protein BCIN_07g03650 [Botrytis cinerea B05.10]ATZ51791.1 hypothetical protein BCIN_07g03650 [Botrytis cinerea B05.10]
MKYLFLYLFLAATSCLLHIYLFSYTLHQNPTDTLPHHSQPFAPHVSYSGSSSSLELEFHPKNAHENWPPTANAMTEMTTSTKGNQGEEGVSTTTYWFGGYGMACKELIMILAVGNPLILGSVVGLVIAVLRGGFGGLVGA